MPTVFHIAFWLLVLIGGIGAMQWGANRVTGLLTIFRQRFGLNEIAAGALAGIATASPEISINVTSVVLGWPDIGLGAALGSNLPAIPLTLTVAYLSMRWHGSKSRSVAGPPPPGSDGKPALELKRDSIFIHALPYLGIVVLLALLTLPPAWQGLQPIDGVILIIAFAVYFGRAILSKRGQPDNKIELSQHTKTALIGVAAIASGAILSVFASDQINDRLGISGLVGGLLITGLLCALPESLAAWPLARSGKATVTASTTLADGTISLTLAFIPLALTGASIGDPVLYGLNLGALAALIILYIVTNRIRPLGHQTGAQVLIFGVTYVIYLSALALVLVS